MARVFCCVGVEHLSNLAAVCVAYGVGWGGGRGDCQGSAVELFFLGAHFWSTLACFAAAAESGHFLFRLNVGAMDAYAFEVALSLAFVLLLRLACVPPNRSEGLLRVWSACPGI